MVVLLEVSVDTSVLRQTGTEPSDTRISLALPIARRVPMELAPSATTMSPAVVTVAAPHSK